MEKFKKDGYLILEDFFTEEEVQEMKEAGDKLTEDIPEETRRVIFSSAKTTQGKSKYFLESNDKIRHFFEADALDENGKLKVDRRISLNKVGHALHWLHPVFRKYSYGDKVKNLCRNMGLEEPRIVQSMYIYKNPGIGSEVTTHQDATYLHTEPEDQLYGFWIALEDATLENGCLWFIPGSHKNGVHRRFVRNPDRNAEELLIYRDPEPFYPSSNFVPAPVKKGTMVVISGLIVHRSEPNKSQKSRHIYTFHVMDAEKAVYSKENWLQPSDEVPFPNIYENR